MHLQLVGMAEYFRALGTCVMDIRNAPRATIDGGRATLTRMNRGRRDRGRGEWVRLAMRRGNGQGFKGGRILGSGESHGEGDNIEVW
jgi:hypothetical protein